MYGGQITAKKRENSQGVVNMGIVGRLDVNTARVGRQTCWICGC